MNFEQMSLFCVITLLCNNFTDGLNDSIQDEYWFMREAIIAAEASYQLGSSIVLSDEEERANQILMNYKLNDLDAAFKDITKYLPAQHFFDTKVVIEQTEIYKILTQMPKGGLLHSHSAATTSLDFLYQQTYRDDLYVCRDRNKPSLKFFAIPDDTCNWESVSHLREIEEKDFETFLGEHMTLVRDDHDKVYTDINKVWSAFEKVFDFICNLIFYKPVWEEHFYDTLNELYKDNITYLEFRGTLSSVYDLNGNTYTPEEEVQIHIDIAEKFKRDHPDFIGVKMIYSPNRRLNNIQFKECVQIAARLKALYPDFISGFDLVGQEDLGRPLKDFADALQTIDLDFFFHAGETNWNQGPTDQNLIDAVLLGSKRIGHGYAAVKHPYVMKEILERNIAIEVSPISNQVLMLVKDMRNHPASIFMADGIPIVITNDDPTLWGAAGVSYDWYMAFMGIASRSADLRLLKQLAINSLEYSAMNCSEKEIAKAKWSYDWDKFIHYLLREYQQ